MRIPLAIALGIAAVACHKAPQVQPEPYRVLGDYSYRMNIGATIVEGEFSIASDTVVLEANEHHCRRVDLGLREKPLSHSFLCAGGPATFRVVVDSKQPTLSTWSSTESVKRSRQVCAAWRTTKDMERVCTAYRKEIYPVDLPISGRLHVTSIAAVDKPDR